MRTRVQDGQEMAALLSADGAALGELYARADGVRREVCGEAVALRAIVEISNECVNHCLYCGIRAGADIRRYRMSRGEVLEAIRPVAEQGLAGTVVLQAGEVATAPADAELEALVREVKERWPGLAVTLSAGLRNREVFARWRAAGADRYLLRFETADEERYARLHPEGSLAERLRGLEDLRVEGYQVGSGFMVGLPGESPEELARNIALCRQLDLDMIGIGPFVAHPGTPLGGTENAYAEDPEMLFRALAVLRLANPDAHIPATTAMDVVRPHGRDLALQRGANVYMFNATPTRFRGDYLLYPGKPGVDETPEEGFDRVRRRLLALGRPADTGVCSSMKPRFRAATGTQGAGATRMP